MTLRPAIASQNHKRRHPLALDARADASVIAVKNRIDYDRVDGTRDGRFASKGQSRKKKQNTNRLA